MFFFMLTIEEIRHRLGDEMQGFEKKYHVERLGIFGSCARGDASAMRDVDIIVELKKPIGLSFIDLAFDLERILNAKVDLVSKNGIKPKYFRAIADEIIYV
jgi:predicted nucleotidyltransferase